MNYSATFEPSIKPLLSSIAFVSIGFWVSLWGCGLVDGGRRLRGYAVLIVGLLFGCIGYLPWGVPL